MCRTGGAHDPLLVHAKKHWLIVKGSAQTPLIFKGAAACSCPSIAKDPLSRFASGKAAKFAYSGFYVAHDKVQ